MFSFIVTGGIWPVAGFSLFPSPPFRFRFQVSGFRFQVSAFSLHPLALPTPAPLLSRHTVTFVDNQRLAKAQPVTFSVTNRNHPVTLPIFIPDLSLYPFAVSMRQSGRISTQRPKTERKDAEAQRRKEEMKENEISKVNLFLPLCVFASLR
jgi:hypothetical protein